MWRLETELSRGYEILLGRPLSKFDAKAKYGFFYWEDFDFAIMRKAEKRDAARKHDDASRTLAWDRFEMDFGRSIWIVDDVEDAAARRGR